MPMPAPMPMPPPCVRTHDRGCVAEADYDALAAQIAGEHARAESFEHQWGLAAIGADRAYANLELKLGPNAEPGEGVIVGVLDTGIDGAHPAFRDTKVSERLLEGAAEEDGSGFSHGTAVASIIAGREAPDFASDASGVAWGADLAVFAIPLGSGDGTYRPRSSGGLESTADRFAGLLGEIIAWRDGTGRIDFLNLSLTVPGLIERYSEADLREPMKPLVEIMAQAGAEEKLVFVWGAANSNGDMCDPALPECVDGRVVASSVSLLPGLAARFPELKPHTLAVVAIGRDGGIADFSNRCGIAGDYCLAAPGEEVTVAYYGPHGGRDGVRATARAPGTSFAAPMVTGGLALMKQMFRGQLSNTDLVARLLETADRSGVYADASVYGRGLMDLGAATSPVGAPAVAVGGRVGGPAAALGATGLRLGGALGGGLAAALAGREVAAFDSLGAPFWYDLGGLSEAARGPSLAGRLRAFGAVSVEEPADEARHLALAGHGVAARVPMAAGLTASALTTEGVEGRLPATGAALAWRPAGAAWGLRAGWLGERRSLLGTVSGGAFGRLKGSAAFAGIETGADLGSWHIGAGAELGAIRARTEGGMLERISPLATSAFELRAARPMGGGTVRVSLSQPLRVETGHARLTIPVGRTRSGQVLHDRITAPLTPNGRQLDLTLQWHRPTPIGEYRLGATLSRHPGHNPGKAEAVAMTGWRMAF